MSAICLDITAVRSQALAVAIPFVAQLPMQRLALIRFALTSKIEQKHNLQHNSQLR